MNTKRFSRSIRTWLMIVTLGLSLTAVSAQAQHHSRHGGHHGHHGYHGYSHLFGYGGHYRHRGYSSHYCRYRPYSYNYRFNDYGDYSRSSSAISRRSLIRGQYAENAIGTSQNTGRSLEDDKGWLLLAQGKARRAKSVFVNQADSYPEAGQPKVGYALSSAMLGDLDKGVWAMRRALRTDPDSLHYLTADDSLQPYILDVADRYEERFNGSGRDPDNPFMIAALRYLLDDKDAARSAIGQAIDNGDESTSTANLRGLLETYSADESDEDTRLAGSDHGENGY